MLKPFNTSQNEVLLALLRRVRKDRRLRQADLAVRLGRGQSTVSKIERGEQRLDIIELRSWLRALDIEFVKFVQELDTKLEDVPQIGAALYRAQ